MMSKLKPKPLAEKLAKTVLLITKTDGEALCRHVGEGVFDGAKLDGEDPH